MKSAQDSLWQAGGMMNNRDLSKRAFLKTAFRMGLIIPGLSLWHPPDVFAVCCQKLHRQILMSSAPLRNPRAVSFRKGNTTIITIHGDRGARLEMNETAAFVWNLCDGKHQVEDIAVLMSDGIDIPPTRCIKDVMSAIRIFRQYGAVLV